MRDSHSFAQLHRLAGHSLRALATLLAASAIAFAQAPQLPPFLQPQQPPANPFGAPASPPVRAPQQTPSAPAASAVIARVGNHDITQAEFDRVAQPYFDRLRSELGAGFDADVRRTASFNVLDELIRRELLAVEVERQRLEVSQDEIDALLRQDPYFFTNGRFDAAKLALFKTGPGSNYLQMMPRLREMAAIKQLDDSLHRRFTPTPAQLNAEWVRRSDRVRFETLPVLTREMPLEPEATPADWTRYYQSHPDQFTRKTRLRLRYATLPLPAASDSTRAAATLQAIERAKSIADSLRHGSLPDTAAGFVDSGLFEVPPGLIPGYGRVTGLTDTLLRHDADSTVRVVGPYTASDVVIVGTVAERQPKHVPPMREVIADVKRRADAEARRVADEDARRAFHETNQARWRGTRAALTRVVLNASTFPVKPPLPQEVERWYAAHGHVLFGAPDSSRAWMPPITDSLRVVVRTRMIEEQRPRLAAESMDRVVAALRSARDVRVVALANGAVAETLSFLHYSAPDSLFGPSLIDSLLASAAVTIGVVQGPRTFGSRWVAWRVDAADTAFIPPYDAVRARSGEAFAADRRARDEADGRVYFDAHRDEFKTPAKYGFDYVAIAIPRPDSVRIPETEIRRQYDANPKDYRQEEQVKARHILFMTRGLGPDAELKAKARADSLLAAIRRDGGDFTGLAKRFSQEPGAATTGGDLGWFGRGRMVKEFDQAAFALKPGEIGPVVKTQFGYHIIKLEDRKAAGTKPFDEVRDAIRARMAQSRADSTARRAAESLRRRLALGGDAKTLAAPHGGVVTAAPITANEPLGALGYVPGVTQDLPAMTSGRWAPGVYRAGDRYLVLRLREKVAPRPAGFDEVKSPAIEAMKDAKRRALLEQKVAAIRAALAAGAPFDSLAAPSGGLKDSGLLGQGAGFVPEVGNEPRVVQKAFAMTPGEVSDTLRVAPGVVWIRVAERKAGDPAAFKTVSAGIEAELTRKRYDEWVEEKKKTVTIEILRTDLKRPRPPGR